MKQSMIQAQGTMPIHAGGMVVCLLLMISGWFFGLSPMLSESDESSSTLEASRLAQEQAQHGKEKLEELTQRVQTMRAELDQKPVSLVPATQINPLLALLSGWADEQRLTITRTNAGQPVVMTWYDYVPISLAGEGDYGDLLGFYHKLYADRGDLGVVSFNVSRLASNTGVSFEIELAWYVVSEQVQPDRTTAQVPTN